METLQPKLRFPEFSGDWNKKIISEISNVTMGQSPSSSSYNTNNDGLPLIQGNADIKNRFTEPRQWTNEPTKICKEGDLILTVRAPVGFVAKSSHNACIGRGVCSINSKNSDLEFIYQFFINFEDKWSKLEQGSTFTAVSGQEIKAVQIKIPNLKEQTKIASFLSSIDTKINQLAQKRNLLEQYKKGIMQKIFTQQIRFKDDNRNDFADWEEKKLGEIGEIVNGLTYSPDDIDENGILVLRSSNVQERRVVYNDNVYVNAKSYNPVIENDILICVRNGSKNLIGKNALINKKSEGFAFGAFMTVYRSKYNKYLFHWFDSSDYKKIVETNLGATINSINNNDLKKFIVPFPSIEEQTKIANFLSAIDENINQVSKQLEQTNQFKKGLLQQLFV